jgi:phosphonate transport system substrate-binding protein
VNASSKFFTFEDLRGARCAFNEPGSHSGCNILRYHLAANGWAADYFGSVVRSGSHRNSIRMLREGTIEVAAIDSSVLELETASDPAIANELRTIATLGPSPAPPWVVHTSVPGELRQALRRAFVSMNKHPAGLEILRNGQLLGFAPVCDSDYHRMRDMDRIATPVKFS